MYPSAEAPSYGIFIRNHVEKMEAEYGIRFRLAVSRARVETPRAKLRKYAELYARTVASLPASFDLVHLHYPSPAFLPAALLPRVLRNKPLVITSHGGDINMPPLDGARRHVVAQIVRRADAVIAVSKDVARMLDALGVPNDRLHVID